MVARGAGVYRPNIESFPASLQQKNLAPAAAKLNFLFDLLMQQCESDFFATWFKKQVSHISHFVKQED